MKIIHYYPSPKPDGNYSNPYSIFYRKALSKHFRIIDTQLWKGFLLPLSLVCSSFRADVYIYNWIENFEYRHLKLIQYYLLVFSFFIIKCRKKKIVWMFHNIHPHNIRSKYSDCIMKYMFNNANLIIAHSLEATEYAKKRAFGNVIYKCHPVNVDNFVNINYGNKPIDILIWGNIFPYKGVFEFVSFLSSKENKLNVRIVGKCNDSKLKKKIEALCTDNISFIDDHVSFDDLQKFICHSKFVLFPYIGDCVSSSGALMDTLLMGGNVVGPNKGAFKDLSEEGCCIVYNNYEELFSIINTNKTLNKEVVESFLRNHSWDEFTISILKYL